MKFLLFCFLVLGGIGTSGAAERTLGEQLAVDNPKVIAYLKALTDSQKVRPLAGVRLSGGDRELAKAAYVDSRHLISKKQHIYLFRVEGEYLAYVWVDAGGSELTIPKDKKGSPGEDAYLLSGDIHTFGKVGPQDGLVILSGATPEWLALQKDPQSVSPTDDVSWVFGKPSFFAPKGSLSLKVDEKDYMLIKKAAATYQKLERGEFKDYGLPREALMAAYSWHAGFGDVVYVLRKGNSLEVYRQEMDESETSRYPVRRLSSIQLP